MLNSLEILHKLGGSSAADKKTFSIYIDEKIWLEFKASCGNVSASEVIEHLLSAFIADLAERKKDPK